MTALSDGTDDQLASRWIAFDPSVPPISIPGSPQHSQPSQICGARTIACHHLLEKEVSTRNDDFVGLGQPGAALILAVSIVLLVAALTMEG